MHLNVEFKARCNELERIRALLVKEGAEWRGKDHQADVYFNVPHGRLKLRKGKIENRLVWYERDDYAGAKQSNVGLFETEPGSSLEAILTNALGVKVVVDKQRDIYFIGNVKFHVDEVERLGSFIEVEAIDLDGTLGREYLQRQCDEYKGLLGIRDEDMIAESYSDLLLKQQKNV
ncbi:MAG TPA: class IV adenylate cyclase [Candidatus Nanoarchaeia archaeon]|nr:class IV adenylate cyclase [Candidatus Nanoarchaeia archaeon]